jgi:hypothetical protein
MFAFKQKKEKKTKDKQPIPRADKKSRRVVKYSAVYEESKNAFRLV